MGGDVLLADNKGNSIIPCVNFGLPVAEETETPKHENARFTVAY